MLSLKPVFAVLLGLVLSVAARLGFAADTGPALEYAIKGTYLYKFGPFVEWPQDTFTTPQSPITICVAGDDPFGAALSQAVAGQMIGTHTITVRHIGIVTRDAPCQIMFVAGSARQSVGDVLDVLRGRPVLTVTDSRRGRARGIISFIIENNRVRFEIDDAEAARNHLVISSELLRLARAVTPRPGTGAR